jgi:hypothetical protein
MSGTFGRTIRDFSKSVVGQELLSRYFWFERFPGPHPSELIQFPQFTDPNLLGAAVDLMLALLVERRNPQFRFDRPAVTLPDRRTRAGKAIRAYMSGGEVSDEFLNLLIRCGARRQRSFSQLPTIRKPRPSDDLRVALRRVHDSASRFDWTVRQFLYRGFLTSSTLLSAEADLILDSTLVEVKTVKDIKHHQEHTSQLLAYYLVSQAPVVKQRDFRIDHLGIYYSRQGQFLKCPVSHLIRFPVARLKRCAFDYLVEFQFWRECPAPIGLSKSSTEHLRNLSLRQLLMEVSPSAPWIAEALKRGPKSKRITVPDSFLLDE